MTERPFEGRSDVVKELYSELNVIKPHSGPGTFFLMSSFYVKFVLMHDISLLELGLYFSLSLKLSAKIIAEEHYS